MKFKKYLKHLNLTPNETGVYLTLLKNPYISITNIAIITNLERASVYNILNRLALKSLIEVTGEKRKKYKANSPSIVLSLLKKKKKSLSSDIESLQNQLPSLLSQFNIISNETKIQYLLSKEEFLNVWKSSLELENTEMLFWGDAEAFVNLVSEKDEWEYMKKRKEKHISMRVLIYKSDISKKIKDDDENFLRTTKYLNDLHKTIQSFHIFGQKVILWNPFIPSAVVIDDINITKLFKTIFETTWASTK